MLDAQFRGAILTAHQTNNTTAMYQLLNQYVKARTGSDPELDGITLNTLRTNINSIGSSVSMPNSYPKLMELINREAGHFNVSPHLFLPVISLLAGDLGGYNVLEAHLEGYLNKYPEEAGPATMVKSSPGTTDDGPTAFFYQNDNGEIMVSVEEMGLDDLLSILKTAKTVAKTTTLTGQHLMDVLCNITPD